MDNAAITIALVLVYGFNVLIAFAATILAVGGDGSSGGTLLVGSILAVVIGSCLAGSIALAGRKMFIRSVLCGIAALPLAFGLTLGIWWLLILIKDLAT